MGNQYLFPQTISKQGGIGIFYQAHKRVLGRDTKQLHIYKDFGYL